MRKLTYSLLAAILLVSLLAGCGASNTTTPTTSASTTAALSTTSTAAATTQPSASKQTVTFWYNNSGDEAKIYENAIAAYNASQDKYEVQGLSVTDAQKLVVAMSGNQAPDAIKISDQDVVTYQSNGLLEDLQPNITKDNFDTSVFSTESVAANTISNDVYGLPLDAYTIQLFYNKDLLAAAGYKDPPTTVEQMYEMAVKATKLDASGNIDVLGYPLFPLASARQELIYAFGGRWWDTNSKPTPDDPGILASLNMNVKYRSKYGISKVQAFIATANTNRYTAQDMFFQGKQLFRIDGSWLPTMMKGFNSTVNYGIALIPGTQANPGLQGTSRFETDSLSIPAMAQNKDGAWDFIKWYTGHDGAKIIDLGTGNLPALKSLYSDSDILAVPGFSQFIDALKLEKGIQYPRMANFSQYTDMMNAALDNVYSGKQTPEKAMADLKTQAATLS